jgi:branched-chain amino acid aminotransferase
MKIYIDGRFVTRRDARISVFDHGFLYGDGVFEGIRAYNGRVFKLNEHLERLYQSAKAICLKIPASPEDMARIVTETVKRNKLKDAYIRLVVSRGEGDLGLDPRKCPKPSIICIAHKIMLYPEEIYKKGLSIVTLSTMRNTPQALNPQIKSLNYLNNILAKIEAVNANAEEGVMLNEKGYVAECTGENIFIVTGNIMMTPPCYIGALKGVTRDVVLELSRDMGLEACERVFTRYDLYNADECFLTGTAAEIVPVVNIDGRKIGPGLPGEITKDLMKRFRRLAGKEGAKV